MVTESLSHVVTGRVVDSEFVVPASYVVEVLSDVVTEALTVGISDELYANMDANNSAAVTTVLDFSI